MAHGLRIQVATYNVNQHIGERLLPELHEWLVPTVTQDASSGYHVPGTPNPFPKGPREAPDIYAIAFQEFTPLPKALAGISDDFVYTVDRELRRAMRGHQAIVRPDKLYDPIEFGGGPENYSLLAAAHHAGLVLYVYSRDSEPQRGGASASSRVREVRTATVGTGFCGVMGNKGAIGVRVVMEDAGREEVLTFVGAHLAAHDHMVERRNADWQSIVTRLIFAPQSTCPLPVVQERYDPSAPLSRQTETTPPQRPPPRPTPNVEYTLYDTHHLFVCGDLNYRIGTGTTGLDNSPPISREDVSTLVEKASPEAWATLGKHDQLAVQATLTPPRVFQQLTIFDVGELTPPTYKYKTDSAAASTSVLNVPTQLNRKRTPGWTDRVLWSRSARLELYRSIMQYTLSDHKPVTAILRIDDKAAALLKSPWPIDDRWQYLQYAGFVCDRIVGYSWYALLLLGSGSIVVAIFELAVLVAIASWWFTTPSATLSFVALKSAIVRRLGITT